MPGRDDDRSGYRETVHRVACTHVQHTSSRDQGREKGKKKERERGERAREREEYKVDRVPVFFFAPRTTDRPFFVAPYSQEPTLRIVLILHYVIPSCLDPPRPFNASWTGGTRERTPGSYRHRARSSWNSTKGWCKAESPIPTRELDLRGRSYFHVFFFYKSILASKFIIIIIINIIRLRFSSLDSAMGLCTFMQLPVANYISVLKSERVDLNRAHLISPPEKSRATYLWLYKWDSFAWRVFPALRANWLRSIERSRSIREVSRRRSLFEKGKKKSGKKKEIRCSWVIGHH